MAVTIKSLAKHLGLSVSTVSKALNGYEDVNEATRIRVRKAAVDLGYQPSAIARSLKTGRTYNLGVIYSDDTESGLTHNYFAPVLQSLRQTAARQGYDLTFIPENNGERRISEHCRFRGVDGLVIVNTHYEHPEIVELLESPLPIVTIDRVIPGRTCVRSKSDEGAADLLRYVLSMGHTRIGIISGDDVPVTRLRLAAMMNVLQEAGIELPKEYYITGVFHDPVSTRVATRRLLSLPTPPTCIMMPDDYAALGGLESIRAAGLSIPNDLSITGFDGVGILQLCRPQLTTVAQDVDTIGKLAASKLIAQVEYPTEFVPEVLEVPCRLVLGETVIAPR